MADDKSNKQREFAEKFESEAYAGTSDDLYSSHHIDNLTNVNTSTRLLSHNVYNDNSLKDVTKFPGQILTVDERSKKDPKNNSFEMSYLENLSDDTNILTYKIRVPSIDGMLPMPKNIGGGLTEKDKKLLDLYQDYSPSSFNEKFNCGDYVEVNYENHHSFKNGKIVTSYKPRYQAASVYEGSGESSDGFAGNNSNLNFQIPGNNLSEPEVAAACKNFCARDPIKGAARIKNQKSAVPDGGWGVFSKKFYDFCPQNVRGTFAGWCWNKGFDSLYSTCKNRIASTRNAESRVSNLINKYSAKFQIDHRLIRAVMNMESGFNASAGNEIKAVGLSQFMPGTYNQYSSRSEVKDLIAAKGGGDQRRDPEVGVVLFCLLLKDNLKIIGNKHSNLVGDWTAAAVGHNSGPGGPSRAMSTAKANGKPEEAFRFLPRETKNFGAMVMCMYAIYSKEIYPGGGIG